jgi:hypothetical protein
MMPYLSRMSGIRVIANSAAAASESCSGIRHRLMSRCERSFVGREASIRGELLGTTLPVGALAADWPALDAGFDVGRLFATRALRRSSWLIDRHDLNHTPPESLAIGNSPHPPQETRALSAAYAAEQRPQYFERRVSSQVS